MHVVTEYLGTARHGSSRMYAKEDRRRLSSTAVVPLDAPGDGPLLGYVETLGRVEAVTRLAEHGLACRMRDALDLHHDPLRAHTQMLPLVDIGAHCVPERFVRWRPERNKCGSEPRRGIRRLHIALNWV